MGKKKAWLVYGPAFLASLSLVFLTEDPLALGEATDQVPQFIFAEILSLKGSVFL